MWNYAQLSHIAKMFGGPAPFTATIVGNSAVAGAAAGAVVGYGLSKKTIGRVDDGAKDIPDGTPETKAIES